MVDKEEFEHIVGRGKKYPIVGRCSYYIIYNNGRYEGIKHHICHAGVRTMNANSGLKEIVTFFRQGPHTDNYVKALINSKWLGDCFLTKDVEEGYEKGFSMNVEQPINVIRGALILLRSPYENELVGKQFDQLLDWGWDTDECLYFSLTTHFLEMKIITPLPILHGKCVDGKLRLKDVVEGKWYKTTTPANVCSYYENICGYVDKAFYENDDHRDYIAEALEAHPSNIGDTNCFGQKQIKVLSNQENMEILRNVYKELESK